jgi:hypothetical protein
MSLADLTPEQLAQRITLYAYELNLMIRAAQMMGVEVHVDIVDREHPEVHVRAGESGWPPIEPRT